MALNAQGIAIRRKSTVAGTTALHSTNTISVVAGSKSIIFGAVGVDLSAFSTGMRVTIGGSTKNAGVYTIATTGSSILTVHDVVTAQASGVTLTIEGHRYDNIGWVKGINGPSGSANVIDVTHLQSVSKEKLIGLQDEGQVSLDVFMDFNETTGQQAAMRQDRANRTLWTYDLLMNDTVAGDVYQSGMNFDAYVSGFTVSAAVDAAVTATITLELTSAIRYIAKV